MARRLTIALACGVLVLATGCGGDDEKANDTDTTPTITVPTDDSTAPTTETTPPETQTAPAPQTTPDSGGAAPPPKPDSPENDTPPAPNTPEQRFEEFCDENPGACG